MRPCCYTCALLAACLGPSPPPCAMHVPVGPTTALLLQSATKHLLPPPWAVHLAELPRAALLQPSSSHLLHRRGPCTWLSCPGPPSCRSRPRCSVRRPRARSTTWPCPAPTCHTPQTRTACRRHGQCTGARCPAWPWCSPPRCSVRRPRALSVCRKSPTRPWRSPPRRSVCRPRARCTCRTSPSRPWGSPGSHTACLRSTVCTPGRGSGGWGRWEGGKPPREGRPRCIVIRLGRGEALQDCRASMLLHMCFACSVPRPLTTAPRFPWCRTCSRGGQGLMARGPCSR